MHPKKVTLLSLTIVNSFSIGLILFRLVLKKLCQCQSHIHASSFQCQELAPYTNQTFGSRKQQCSGNKVALMVPTILYIFL
jgi:hypothetical protein